jgi:3-oxoacyl-[acyl-carrier-protein] synthase II
MHAGVIADLQPVTPAQVTTIFACHGSWRSVYEIAETYFSKGPQAIRPSSLPRFIPSAAPSQISMRYKLTGANYVVMSACSSSTTAMGIAFRSIRDGHFDAALCGGTDSPFDPFVFGGWSKLGVMSPNQDPLKACRPFDADRDGCVLGEGAAAVVMESEDRARARGARVFAEIVGYGESSDASHITRPEPEGQARAIRGALSSAGVCPEEIGMISAHGTATRSNDVSESQAVNLALGDAGSRIPVVSHKSYVGHMLGASGTMECIISILGVQRGGVPSNLNLDRIDPECSVNATGGAPVKPATPIILKNSFGFGGSNSVLVIRGIGG